MKIQYLSDLKKALKGIPKRVLDALGFGIGEDSDDIGLCRFDGEDFWDETWDKKYPQINDISKWIDNIKKASIICHEQEDLDELYNNLDDAISSDTNFDKLLNIKEEEDDK